MNKNVLITAGTKNIGYVIAEKMAENGYDVHITSRRLKEAKTAAKQLEIKYPNIKAYGYSLELCDLSSITSLFAEIKKQVGALDAFVANAANLGVDVDTFSANEKTFDEIMDTNVKGTFFCCQEAGKLMTRHGGSIVLIGSVQSKGAVEGRCVYGMSKAAISALNIYLSYDLAPYSIRSNCVVAGAVHTNRWDALDDDIANKRRINYPLQREADASDIANGVYFLASDLSKSTTGTELVIDSGVLTSLLPYKDRKVTRHCDYI